MQLITMYLRADSVNARLVDEYNQTINTLPALTRGMRAELILKLLDGDGEPVSTLINYASWDFIIADDWNTETHPQIRVVDGIFIRDNEVHIPLTETNTEELIAALGTQESKQFGCELAGFEAGETVPGYLLQFNITIRNRRGDAGTGTPTPVTDASYSAAQINALFAARLEVELSDDGSVWYAAISAEVPETARFYHFRNSAVGGDWSDPLPLIVGPKGDSATVTVGAVTSVSAEKGAAVTNTGTNNDAVLNFSIPQGQKGNAGTVTIGAVTTLEPDAAATVTNSGTDSDAVLDFGLPRGKDGAEGKSSYVTVAYAENSNGVGFSTLPLAHLKYRAEIVSDSPISQPQLSDFANATWVKYIGDDSTVYGDVLVTDNTTAVDQVTRIVFENATVRQGVDGEVFVNFKVAGVPVYSIFSGNTRQSSTLTSGSPFGDLELDVLTVTAFPVLTELSTPSTFIGAI